MLELIFHMESMPKTLVFIHSCINELYTNYETFKKYSNCTHLLWQPYQNTQTVWLKQQEYILSQFWRLQV